MRRSLLLLVAFCGLGQSARADRDHMIGVRVGGSIGVSDELDELSDTSLSITAFASGPIASVLGWRVEGGQDRFSSSDFVTDICADLEIDCDDPRITRFNGGVQITGHGGIITAYGYLTVGAYSLDPGGPAGGDSSVEAGLSYGGAINLNLGPSLFLGFDFDVNTVFPDEFADTDNSQTYVVPSFQIGARF